MKVLLTGGAGFIGSHVAEAYLAAGLEVVIVDNASTGRLSNVPGDAKFYLLDIGAQELEKVFDIEKPDFVNHHAAQISVVASARDPILDARVNSLGLLNVLQLSVRYHVQKFVLISTGGAIYGDTDIVPTPEDHPARPMSPYGIHKLLGENYLRFYRHQHGLDYTVLRYGNVYGPRQNPEGEAGVIAIFVNTLLDNRVPSIYAFSSEPDGMARDYVYVKDVAEANVLAVSRAPGEIVNIGTGIATRTRVLYDKICAVLGKSPQPKVAEARPAEVRYSCLDGAKARRLLAWTPSHSLDQGIRQTIEHFKEVHHGGSSC